MRILVTGATGFLGGHLVEGLLQQGHQPVAMARKRSNTSLLQGLGVEVRNADLTDPSSLRDAVHGMEAVVHLAAYYTFSGKKELYQTINVEGTKALLQAMLKEGVGKIVYCSSTEAMGPTPQGIADENSECHPVYEYGRSKLRAEEAVRYYEEKGLEYVILRPSGIYGPRNVEDVSFWFITTFANSFLSRFIVGDGKKVLQFVHVKDVVQGFLRALDRFEDVKGNTYIISDSRAYSYEEIYALTAKTFNKKPPRWHIPVALAKTMVAPVQLFNWLRGKDNFLWRVQTIDTFKVDRNYSIDKARRELGYEPQHPLPEGLRETVEWYRQHGYIK